MVCNNPVVEAYVSDMKRFFALLSLVMFFLQPLAAQTRIVFLAGNKSHRSGDHEFRAGCMLLAKALNEESGLDVRAQVISGWPEDDTVLDGADAIVIYCDSDSVHRDHYDRLMQLNDAGTGLFFMHYGVHPKLPESGEKYYMKSVGGYMETGYSVNPHWAANIFTKKDHPVHRGCEEPIEAFDEFYYHLRFADDVEGCKCTVHDLGMATPEKSNMVEGSNLWNKNATENYGKPQRLLWGFEGEDGRRGGGFTGGHYHRNWAIDGYRRMILNTIVWIAGMEVPEGGVKSDTVDEEEINANLDEKRNMVHIELPLKSAMEYRQDMLDGRKARAEAKRREQIKRKLQLEGAQ